MIIRQAFFAFIFLMWESVSRAEGPAPIEIAILPYFSTRTLLQQFEPLRAAVEKRLGRPVYLVTAPDYATFVRRTQERAYPFVITGPHLGRLAQVDAGDRPLLQWRAKLAGVFLVDKTSPIQTLADLDGRSVGTPDLLAVTTMLGESTLLAEGLMVPGHVRFNPQPSHNAALLSVLRGENAAALVWDRTLTTLDADVAGRLRELARTEELPIASLFLASPTMPPADADALTRALLGFAASGEGQEYMAKTGYNGIIPVEESDLVQLDRFLPLTRRVLGEH